eukprot:m.269308 g.269308  ORF g.269308 m.269308 type:complete len:66 (-) comp15670_c0_seq8:1341-1538(-)
MSSQPTFEVTKVGITTTFSVTCAHKAQLNFVVKTTLDHVLTEPHDELVLVLSSTVVAVQYWTPTI